jgi:hypothetical protein
MCRMIAELVVDVSYRTRQYDMGNDKPENALPRARYAGWKTVMVEH